MMRALSLTGRQADALEAYREGRGHLMDQLGIEPGRELRELHRYYRPHRYDNRAA